MSVFQHPAVGLPTERRLLKPAEAARILGVCDKTLYNMTKRGSLPCVREGRWVRYDSVDLEKWIEERKDSGTNRSE